MARPFQQITQADVGRNKFKAFGRSWPVEDFIGQILPQDVGKRVYLIDGILQVENNEQLRKRLNPTVLGDAKTYLPSGTKVRTTKAIHWHNLHIPKGAVGLVDRMLEGGAAARVKFDDRYGSFDCWADELRVV
jgi:hypothetical protein